MKTVQFTLLSLIALLSLSTNVLAQSAATAQPNPSSMPLTAGSKRATHKKAQVHSVKKADPKSAKVDADSVSNGAPGDAAKGGQ